MNRRGWLFGGVAAGALAAGGGLALWRSRPPAGRDVWSMSFERPGGGRLNLAEWRGRPLVLNFWATWCPPCVTELPLLDRFQREHASKGWGVVGLAVDQPAPVDKFLAAHPVGFPIGLAGLDGVALSRQLGNTKGALPFSLVFSAGGALAETKLGVIEAADIQRWTASTA